MARGCGSVGPGAVVAVAIALAALSACGTTPSAPTAPRSRPTLPPPLPLPSTAPAPPDTRAADIVAQSRKAFSALPGYRTDMRFFQKAGSKSSKGLYDLAGKPPRAMRIEIKEGSSPGTRILWTGGKTVKARPGGFLSPIVVDLSLRDDRLVSVRGYSLDQIDITSLLDMLGDPRGRLAYAGKTGTSEVLTTAGSHLLPGCSKMFATLDATTHLPTGVDMSDGREVVFRIRLEGFRADPGVKLEI